MKPYSFCFNRVHEMATKNIDYTNNTKKRWAKFRIVGEYLIHFCGWGGGICDFARWHSRDEPLYVKDEYGKPTLNPNGLPPPKEIEEVRDEILKWVAKFREDEWEKVTEYLQEKSVWTNRPEIMEGVRRINVMRAFR